jgi:hypothetical protein
MSDSESPAPSELLIKGFIGLAVPGRPKRLFSDG